MQASLQKEQLLSRLDNNKALKKKLQTLYISERQPKLAAMDRETVRFTAHALKDNSAAAGAKFLCDLPAEFKRFSEEKR